MQHVRYDILASTNGFLMEKLRSADATLADGCIVSCGFQGAGRGQMGNSWESAAGANALFSIAFRQLALPAMEHFRITQAVALAVVDFLCQDARFLPLTAHKDLRIKWPNDIYYQDKKLAGILIESLLAGSKIQDCVCGIGLNLNQEVFLSDAPNPTSLQLIAKQEGEKHVLFEEKDIVQMIEGIGAKIVENIRDLREGRLSSEDLQARYLDKLYRYRQWHAYQDQEGVFEGRILDILPDGQIQIEITSSQAIKHYAFKELKFLI